LILRVQRANDGNAVVAAPIIDEHDFGWTVEVGHDVSETPGELAERLGLVVDRDDEAVLDWRSSLRVALRRLHDDRR
jgi:hypothetical protein